MEVEHFFIDCTPGQRRVTLKVHKDWERRKGLIFVRDLMTSLSIFLSDCGFRGRVRQTNNETGLLLSDLDADWEKAFILALSEDVYGDRFSPDAGYRKK